MRTSSVGWVLGLACIVLMAEVGHADDDEVADLGRFYVTLSSHVGSADINASVHVWFGTRLVGDDFVVSVEKAVPGNLPTTSPDEPTPQKRVQGTMHLRLFDGERFQQLDGKGNFEVDDALSASAFEGVRMSLPLILMQRRVTAPIEVGQKIPLRVPLPLGAGSKIVTIDEIVHPGAPAPRTAVGSGVYRNVALTERRGKLYDAATVAEFEQESGKLMAATWVYRRLSYVTRDDVPEPPRQAMVLSMTMHRLPDPEEDH